MKDGDVKNILFVRKLVNGSFFKRNSFYKVFRKTFAKAVLIAKANDVFFHVYISFPFSRV